MTRVKTYWDEIKNDEVYFHGGSQGWEVKLGWVEYWKWDQKTGEQTKTKKLELQFPFGYGDGVKASEKSQTRKEVNFQKKQRKILAQASRNRQEFEDLNNRVYRMSNEDFNDILKSGLKGFSLGQYIREKHLTEGEAYSLFWRM